MERPRRTAGRRVKPAGGFTGRIGVILRARREELNLRLAHVCERTGWRISTSQLSGYERGVEPGVEKMFWLAFALEMKGIDALMPSEASDILRRKVRTLYEAASVMEATP